MATFDLQEQDQLEDLKAWWARYGNIVAGVVLAISVGFIGVQGWRWYQGNHQEAAATLYNAVSEGVRSNDAAKSKDAMAQLADRYTGTPYAARAALLYAKQLWDAGDKAGARTQLNFVIDHANSVELAEVARYRLAQAALDDGKTDEALRLLDAKTDDAFAGMYADLRGDALMAAGRTDDARTAYQTSLAKLDQRSPYRSYVEVKYQALGGTAPPPGAPPPGAPDTAAAVAIPAAAAPAASAPASTPAPAGSAAADPASAGDHAASTAPAVPAPTPTKP
jgi:predicted negative regulator of RcsB-dependent stress response